MRWLFLQFYIEVYAAVANETLLGTPPSRGRKSRSDKPDGADGELRRGLLAPPSPPAGHLSLATCSISVLSYSVYTFLHIPTTRSPRSQRMTEWAHVAIRCALSGPVSDAFFVSSIPLHTLAQLFVFTSRLGGFRWALFTSTDP